MPGKHCGAWIPLKHPLERSKTPLAQRKKPVPHLQPQRTLRQVLHLSFPQHLQGQPFNPWLTPELCALLSPNTDTQVTSDCS